MHRSITDSYNRFSKIGFKSVTRLFPGSLKLVCFNTHRNIAVKAPLAHNKLLGTAFPLCGKRVEQDSASFKSASANLNFVRNIVSSAAGALKLKVNSQIMNGDTKDLRITGCDDPIVNRAYQTVVKFMSESSDPSLKMYDQWIRKALDYNVPHGKRNRLMFVVDAYQAMEEPNKITPKMLELASILGWCVELLQAFFLLLDDIMDDSLTRRGKPCWYRCPNTGLIAINDAVIFNNAIYPILKAYFKWHPLYMQIVELFFECGFATSQGQCLDMLGEKNNIYTLEYYKGIVKYKTSIYSFVLPVRLGILLAGIDDKNVHEEAKRVTLKVGEIFQIQDDYLDCYGTPEIIGKIGTDIIDRKCSWLYVTALQLCTPEQRKRLDQNYGKGEVGGPEEAEVKKIFNELKLEEKYRQLEESTFDEIENDIRGLNKMGSLQKALNVVCRIKKRSK